MKTADQNQIRFGIIALEKGFITSRQLGKAVNTQLSDDLERGKHRLIGEILVDMGFMTVSQVEEVLDGARDILKILNFIVPKSYAPNFWHTFP
ncbi:MAG: hypothetical protein JRI94_04730 [Deltaproteobacteria bacterium]|nr:hypothetical protein [Deltaproteobacteria bacterium]